MPSPIEVEKESLSVKYIPISDLTGYKNNARTHSDEQVDQLVASIKQFGFTNPVLVDGENGIIAGHGRVLAARKMGMGSVPVVELAHLTGAQKRAYILADNKLALNAGWDDAMLAHELDELRDAGFDLPTIGFSQQELNDLIGTPNTGFDPDETPPVPVAPVSRTGDLWILGEHRLLCGDSTKAEDVERLMDGAKPILMVTDPPYGVDYDPDWRNRAKRAGGLQAYGASSIGVVQNDDRADWSEAWALFPGEVAYVWHGALHALAVADSLTAVDFEIRAQIIWAKQHAPISRGHYHWKHEPCWYVVRKSGTGHWGGDRTQTTLWEVANGNAFGGQDKEGMTGHGTQKPVEIMARAIRNHEAPQVYDPFVGSGTTIIAAEMTGRRCYAMEIAPQYVDVSVLRWQAFTGREATLDGRTFDEVRAARQ